MRTYKRKTKRGIIPHDTYKEAADDVLNNGLSVPQAAKKHDVKYITLLRYVKKLREFREQESSETQNFCEPKTGYTQSRKIFTDGQEMKLFNYLEDHSDVFFGFSIKDLKLLAYDFARYEGIMIPKTWETNSEAGREWVLSFKERNPNLKIRIQEATSTSTTPTLKKSVIDSFYDQLEKLYNQCQFAAKDIYNVDEIEVSILPKFKNAAEETKKYLEIRATKEIPLVTMCFAVNATGKIVPPMFIFPRENFLKEYLKNSPHDSIGCANPLGLITRYDFLTYIKHFCNYTGATTKHPVLLVLDNHESHISMDILNFCKINGIFLLSFPTNCSYKLQPTERSVIQPFQRRYKKILDKWLESNPGKSATISDVPRMVKEVFLMKLTESNIRSGFEVTGIWPLKRDVFTDKDFASETIKKEIKKQNKLKQSSMALRLPNDPERLSLTRCLPSFITVSSNNKSEEKIEVIELQSGTLKESAPIVVLELTVQLENIADPVNLSSPAMDGSSPPIDGSSLPKDGVSHLQEMDTLTEIPETAMAQEEQPQAKEPGIRKIAVKKITIPEDGNSLPENGSSLSMDGCSLPIEGNLHLKEMKTLIEIPAETSIAQEEQSQIKESGMRDVAKRAFPKDSSSLCKSEVEPQPLGILTRQRKLLHEMEPSEVEEPPKKKVQFNIQRKKKFR